MELTDYLKLIRAHWRGVIVLGLLGVVLAGAYSLSQPKIYAANASGLVTGASDGDVGLQSLNDSLAKSKVKDYVVLATDRSTAQQVISDLKLSTTPDALVANISVSQPLDTSVIQLTAHARSPLGAQQLADAWVRALAERIQQIEDPNNKGGAKSLHLEVSTSAALPGAPVSPRTRLNLVLGLLVGLLAGFAYAIVRKQIDRRLRDSAEVERLTGAPVIGTIPDSPELRHEYGQPAPLVVLKSASASTPSAEAFRKLRTNLQYMDVDNPPRVIVMTSPQQSDGKSTLSANLAAAIAVSGQPVTLVDADLRRPTAAATLGVDGAVGVTDVLAGRLPLSEATQRHADVPGLHVLAAGAIPPNPSELLASQAMAALLMELSEQGMVIVDAPPLLPVTDAAVLSRHADGVLVAMTAGRTLDTELQHALGNLSQVQAKVLGILMNRVSRRTSPDSVYGNYGRYGRYYRSDYTPGQEKADGKTAKAARTAAKRADEGTDETARRA